MAWTNPTEFTTGHLITAAEYKRDITDNLTYLKTYAAGENPKELPVASAMAPLSGLTAAAIEVAQSGSATIKPQWYKLRFDGAADEGRMWIFSMPSSYVDQPKVIVKFHLAEADTATRTVIFNAQLAAITNGDGSVDGKAFATTNAGSTAINGTAYVTEQQTITMTNADSVAAGDEVCLVVWRDADTDTCVKEAVVTYVGLSYNQ